ncbi:MAG: 2,3-bisphosphoglycerate-independent phosphoglycerate mutase [Clostridiales bacterium]|nr:2,3-bisphosphoglycerate-independent phosphoglycerate mutase [Clostridiales bacterium]
MKHILIIGDGMADNPIESLGGKTPLEAARIPYIDSLAAKGDVFSVRTVPIGQVPGSDTANLTIFGCDPSVYYTGRAPLEAASAGIILPEGSAAYRCNVMSVSDEPGRFEDKRLISHSAGSIDGAESDAIVTWLFSDPEFRAAAERARMVVYPGSSFRHIAVQESADLKGLYLAPPHDYLGDRVEQHKPYGNKNAEILWDLMVLAHERLSICEINERRRREGLPVANAIWFWAEGTAVSLPRFPYSQNGTVISAVPLFKGIARLTGLKTVDVAGATGTLDTNYRGKVDAAIRALTGGDDFVTIHIEAPDECTHDGDLKGKIQAIENIDNLIVRPLLEELGQMVIPYRLLLLSDHKTLMSNRAHDGDPVPCLLYSSDTDTRRNGSYSEAEGERSYLVDPGTLLMGRLFEE